MLVHIEGMLCVLLQAKCLTMTKTLAYYLKCSLQTKSIINSVSCCNCNQTISHASTKALLYKYLHGLLLLNVSDSFHIKIYLHVRLCCSFHNLCLNQINFKTVEQRLSDFEASSRPKIISC